VKMKRTKIASALLLVAASGWASAQEVPDSKAVDFTANADFVAAAEGNAITLTQTAPQGNEVGNESVLSQEGDLNAIVVDVTGDANEVLASQMQSGNTLFASITGNGNFLESEQDSLDSTAEFLIEGDDNVASLVQLGDGGPFGFIFSRSINSISGSGNTLSIYQGDGGNWANNAIFGNDNAVFVDQSGDWHESYVRELSGDANEIDVVQDGFYNISDLTVIGSDNEIEIDQDGDDNVIGWSMVGDANVLEFEQDGNGNEIATGAFDGSDNEVNIDQIGDINLATVETIGGIANTFEINQVGTSNIAYAGVIGLFNEFDLTQVGDANEISAVNFDGFFNTVEIEQDGDANLALAQAGIGESTFIADGNIIEMSQEGIENVASVELASNANSNFNEIMVSQSGELNLLDLLVNGNDNIISVMQEGVGNWVTDESGGQFAITGDANTFEVTQMGNDNLVTGSITGNGGTVSVTQVGDYNVATVVQM